MKKHAIKIAPLFHNGKQHIGLYFAYDNSIKAQIKTLPEWRWTQTHRCFYVPYSKASYAALKKLFEVKTSEDLKLDELKEIPKEKTNSVKQKIIRVSDFAYSKKKRTKPRFIKKQYGEDYQKLVVGDSIIISKMNQEWLEIYIPFDKKGWQDVVKNIPGRSWDMEEKFWKVPNVKDSYRLLKKHIGMAFLKFDFNIVADIPDAFENPSIPKRKTTRGGNHEKLPDLHKGEILKLVEKLTLKRRSIWTIKSYKTHLSGLFFYYKNVAPPDITKEQFSKYLLHLIRQKKISESTQNQVISAVKIYWEWVLKRDKEWIEVPRPKKPKKLPNVLSTQEVIELIKVPKNLKHKLALLLIYSAGLRKSELLNLLKKDINIKRRAIHIKSGKGKKDRYVALAETVLPYLETYLKQYKPTRWLFEGQTGGKYSGSSLQRIFENALKSSKVNPYATIHGLRHSYATHCIEQGHNIRQVQEALGHGSIKTTEVYLHISSDALKKLQSPLDNLNLK